MAAQDPKQLRLLLVDDEGDFRNTLAKRLRKRGIDALQAADGKGCLAVIADSPVDVIVMDVMMPGINGIETLFQIKKRYPDTEIILLTGNANTKDGVEGIKSGAFDYLTKPVEFDHLLGKIYQAYDKIKSDQMKKAADAYKVRIEQQMVATERLAALGTLAAGVAHEINNPLAIINEAAGLMKSLLRKAELTNVPYKATFDKAIEKVENSVKRARAITHQLLDDVGKSECILAEINLASLARETFDLIRREAEKKGLRLKLEADENMTSVWADPNKIRQVLINLLSNAIHASYENDVIVVRLQPTDTEALIEVIDSGTGISKENLDRIFEPFFSTKTPGEGTGLGLFVTREIVEKCGGQFSVESKLGEGTRFSVRIPNQVYFGDDGPEIQ